MTEQEIPIHYPLDWEDEYRVGEFPRVWRSAFPELFDGVLDGSRVRLRNTGTLGTLSEFFEYALMYLLRKNDGVCSLTYFELAGDIAKSAVGSRRKARHETMRKWIGLYHFEKLQSAIKAGFSDRFSGEPDLFCWHPETKNWFF